LPVISTASSAHRCLSPYSKDRNHIRTQAEHAWTRKEGRDRGGGSTIIKAVILEEEAIVSEMVAKSFTVNDCPAVHEYGRC
jgi:hypothetical protein